MRHVSRVIDKDWPNYLMNAIQRLGPGYVKLCQWIATRRDLFPVYVCDRLSQLHDQAHPHSFKQSHKILMEAFGDYQAKGLHLEEVIGSGSAAQVYKGTLTLDNENDKPHPVAVKILHPWFHRQISNDLWLMETVAKRLHALPSETLRMVNLPRAVSNFGANLRRQTDLRLERDNLKQFRSNFYGKDDDETASAILFPRPIDGWVSSKVLVEDLVEDATPIGEFLKDASELGLETRKELAGPLLRAFLKMVFQDNFVHCDLHPGNVLIQTTTTPFIRRRTTASSVLARILGNPEGSKVHNDSGSSAVDGTASTTTTKRTIVFLDAGIATSLNENDRKNLKDLFRAVILNNGYEAGRLMVERARYERCSQKEGGVEAFASGVGEIVAEFHDRRKQGLTLGAVRIGSLLSRVLDLCREHGVEIDPAMASIVISTLVLEGLGRSLEPSLNLMDCAVPFVLGRGKV
jgi:aarF domain-containing kinase